MLLFWQKSNRFWCIYNLRAYADNAPNGTRACSKVPLGWCISWARVSGSISSRAVTEMIAWGKEIPGTQITGQREPKWQGSLYMRGHDILTHWCEINLIQADIWHVGYHCSYLGTMSFPRTTDVMNFFVYSTSGKLWQTRLHHNDFIMTSYYCAHESTSTLTANLQMHPGGE